MSFKKLICDQPILNLTFDFLFNQISFIQIENFKHKRNDIYYNFTIAKNNLNLYLHENVNNLTLIILTINNEKSNKVYYYTNQEILKESETLLELNNNNIEILPELNNNTETQPLFELNNTNTLNNNTFDLMGDGLLSLFKMNFKDVTNENIENIENIDKSVLNSQRKNENNNFFTVIKRKR